MAECTKGAPGTRWARTRTDGTRWLSQSASWATIAPNFPQRSRSMPHRSCWNSAWQTACWHRTIGCTAIVTREARRAPGKCCMTSSRHGTTLIMTLSDHFPVPNHLNPPKNNSFFNSHQTKTSTNTGSLMSSNSSGFRWKEAFKQIISYCLAYFIFITSIYVLKYLNVHVYRGQSSRSPWLMYPFTMAIVLVHRDWCSSSPRLIFSFAVANVHVKRDQYARSP